MTKAQTPTASPSLQRGRPEPVLTLQQVSKYFKPAKDYRPAQAQDLTPQGFYPALQDLTLEIYPGQVTVLLGANGAGKSTTLACMQGLMKPDEGRVQLLGQNPWQASPQLRAQVGIMLQESGLPQSARPLPLLRHLARLYARPLDPDQLAAQLGIDRYKGSIRRLSGGQKQKVALAAALIGQPKVLFLDEPTAGMDPQARTQVFDLIRQLKEQGVAIILTTHLLDDAQKIADHIYMLHQGRLLASGPIDDFLARGQGKEPELSFQTAPGLSLHKIWPAGPPMGLELTQEAPGHYRLTGPLTPQHLADLTAYWAAQGILPQQLSLAKRSLEDIYLELAEGKDA